jgi:hypothetical protein
MVTLPVNGVPEQVMPEATSSGVAVTVYEPPVLPDTEIEEVVELPVNPLGNDHE